MLKWACQPGRRSKSWRASINESRDRIEDLLEESPSLKNELASSLVDRRVYNRAVRDARLDTEGKIEFPPQCPWSLDEVVDPDVFPDWP